jgi:hypothetical protein
MIRRAYYGRAIAAFVSESEFSILGELAQEHSFSLETQQRQAWVHQIAHLKQELSHLRSGEIFLEFAIPRMGKRVDAIVHYEDVVFVIEYKVGARTYDRAAIDQVLDYALDLKHFHEHSHDKLIVPILVATSAPATENDTTWFRDNVAKPLRSNGSDLSGLIDRIVRDRNCSSHPGPGLRDNGQAPFRHNPVSDQPAVTWADGGYRPTPTIIEAAQALYQGHNVQDISRSDAGAKNLTATTAALKGIIDRARKNSHKSICFVTGVPGAGKTLAGLDISTQTSADAEDHAVFLSGNGPLVTVLREALARDEIRRAHARGERIDKSSALKRVGAFIQNIHHFRDEGLRTNKPPIEHVVVFDEAQRAWNQQHAERFMTQKRGLRSFSMSEPEFLISVMDRRPDWATIICLIGGGQEINTGEAGLVEWFNALENHFPAWRVYHSGHLSDSTYNWGIDLNAKLRARDAIVAKDLHLAVSVRSFRAEKLSDFVGAIIDGDASRAQTLAGSLANYPIALTRDLETARRWLRERARGTERIGLVASSGAMRLKPEGLHVKAGIDPANWFLNGKDDLRSSYSLEDVATEFDIQGLELDWIGVCWDADLRRSPQGWAHYRFHGTRWQNIGGDFRRAYLSNAYRVLLTRARQGMIVYVPKGSVEDETRQPAFYDAVFDFLKDCGFPAVQP